jgi:hypothetical protein
MTSEAEKSATPVVRHTEDGEGTEVACPGCGSTEFQEFWHVASTAPVEVRVEGERFIATPDYDCSKVIWDAVLPGGVECRSCCLRADVVVGEEAVVAGR